MKKASIVIAAVSFSLVGRDANAQTTADSVAVMSAFAKQVAVESSGYSRLGFSGSFDDELRRTASTPNAALRSSWLIRSTVAATGRRVVVMDVARAFTPDVVAERKKIVSSLDRTYWLRSLRFNGERAELSVDRYTDFHDDPRGFTGKAEATYIFEKIGSEWRFVDAPVSVWTSLFRDPMAKCRPNCSP